MHAHSSTRFGPFSLLWSLSLIQWDPTKESLRAIPFSHNIEMKITMTRPVWFRYHYQKWRFMVWILYNVLHFLLWAIQSTIHYIQKSLCFLAKFLVNPKSQGCIPLLGNWWCCGSNLIRNLTISTEKLTVHCFIPNTILGNRYIGRNTTKYSNRALCPGK